MPLFESASTRRGEKDFLFREQRRVLEHSAEFFLGHVMMRAFVAVWTGHFFVIHGQPLQPHDAKVAVAFFPNLTLF